MKTKIEIKTFGGNLLFEFEAESNSVKKTLMEAVSKGANLRGANLQDANLRGADLRGAYLRGVYLRGAENIPYIPLACPSDGAFIGWKKLKNNLIKLLIPEDAKRSSAITNKCRCDKAKVLSIVEIDTGKDISEITNDKYATCIYKVGEMVFPDKFDEDRFNECSNGIHFFINKEEALRYE